MADPVIITRHGTSTPDTGDLADFQLGYDSAADILYIRDGTGIITLGGSAFSFLVGQDQTVTRLSTPRFWGLQLSGQDLEWAIIDQGTW